MIGFKLFVVGLVAMRVATVVLLADHASAKHGTDNQAIAGASHSEHVHGQ